MSPGSRPNHFGAKPLHMTSPTSVATTPIITMNFPNSRIPDLAQRTQSKQRMCRKQICGPGNPRDRRATNYCANCVDAQRCVNAGTVSRLLRETRGPENVEREQDAQDISTAAEHVTPRRGSVQKA